jgi:hypothetical protein
VALRPATLDRVAELFSPALASAKRKPALRELGVAQRGLEEEAGSDFGKMD